jgi:hypothetical protein
VIEAAAAGLDALLELLFERGNPVEQIVDL